MMLNIDAKEVVLAVMISSIAGIFHSLVAGRGSFEYVLASLTVIVGIGILTVLVQQVSMTWAATAGFLTGLVAYVQPVVGHSTFPSVEAVLIGGGTVTGTLIFIVSNMFVSMGMFLASLYLVGLARDYI